MSEENIEMKKQLLDINENLKDKKKIDIL